MRRIIAIATAATVVAALVYLAGAWPARRQLTEAQGAIRTLQGELASAAGRIRLGELLGRLLNLSDAIDARNYGAAARLSSTFFDAVRDEMPRVEPPGARQALEAILQTRDRVTMAIAHTDPALPAMLKEHAHTLRRALGYADESTP